MSAVKFQLGAHPHGIDKLVHVTNPKDEIEGIDVITGQLNVALCI